MLKKALLHKSEGNPLNLEEKQISNNERAIVLWDGSKIKKRKLIYI